MPSSLKSALVLCPRRCAEAAAPCSTTSTPRLLASGRPRGNLAMLLPTRRHRPHQALRRCSSSLSARTRTLPWRSLPQAPVPQLHGRFRPSAHVVMAMLVSRTRLRPRYAAACRPWPRTSRPAVSVVLHQAPTASISSKPGLFFTCFFSWSTQSASSTTGPADQLQPSPSSHLVSFPWARSHPPS